MKIFITFISLATVVACANAKPVAWKERGNTVSAIDNSVEEGTEARSLKPTEMPVHTLKLSTGQTAILTGGVYVKTDDIDELLVWANNNGHTAKEDVFSKGVVHFDSDPSDSIDLANEIAQVSGVSTAAPNYKTPKVLK